MADCIEDSLSHGAFVKGRNLHPEEVVLVALAIIAQIDVLPERIVKQEKSFAEVCPVLSRTRCFGRAVFKNNLGLCQMLDQGGAGTEKQQCRVSRVTLDQEFCVRQDLLIRKSEQTRVA